VKPLAYLGNASYSLYLSHVFTLGATRFLWTMVGLDRVALSTAVAFEMVGMTLSILGAVIVYRWLELSLIDSVKEPPYVIAEMGTTRECKWNTD
jgi:exopolysaccharide production protein ExoZ